MARNEKLGRWLPLVFALCALGTNAAAENDPLPSWNEGAAKTRILTFVKQATDQSSATFVELEDRIAVFDQDGTLWVEQPIYTQAMFAFDQVKRLAPRHPEWTTTEPFKTVLAGDPEALSRLSPQDVVKILAATHTGMSTDEFRVVVRQWIATAKHPKYRRPYTELVYQPMLELMRYLQRNGFRSYIVTGGGQEFVRAFSMETYGIPPERVIGSSVVTRYEVRGGKPVLVREPKSLFVNDAGGKPAGIEMYLGKRPAIAFGNSDGDREMLEWTTLGRNGMAAIVLHTDAGREAGYGPAAGLPDTKVGTFSQALFEEAKQNPSWLVIDMKRDWRVVFRFESVAGLSSKNR